MENVSLAVVINEVRTKLLAAYGPENTLADEIAPTDSLDFLFTKGKRSKTFWDITGW